MVSTTMVKFVVGSLDYHSYVDTARGEGGDAQRVKHDQLDAGLAEGVVVADGEDITVDK